MTEENNNLKGLNFPAEEKQKLELQLATAQSEASFNLSEKNRIKKELSEAKEENSQLSEVASRVKEAEDQIQSLKIKLRQEQETSKLQRDEKTAAETSLKIAQQEIAEYRHDIPKIEEEKRLAFETGLLVARHHVDKYPFWDKIDWTSLKVPINITVPVPSYFLQPSKIKNISEEELKKSVPDKGKEQ